MNLDYTSESPSPFASAFHHAPIGIGIATLEGRWLRVNPSFCQMTGYSEAELLGKSFLDLTSEEDRIHDLHKMNAMIDQKQLHNQGEKRILHRDGYFVWGWLTVSLVLDEQGRPLQFVVHLMDITERKLTNLELRKAKGSLEEAQRIAQIGSWEWDVGEDEVYWSAEMHRIFDLRPEQYSGKFNLLVEYVHPEDRSRFEQAVAAAFKGEDYDLRCRIVGEGDQDIRHVHIMGKMYYDHKGTPVKMVGTVQDITKRVLTERQLEETLQRYHSLKMYNPDGIFTFDMQGRISGVNPAAEQLLGYTFEELVSEEMRLDELIHSEELPQNRRSGFDFFNSALKGSMPYTLRHKDGRLIDVIATPAPIVIQDQVVGYNILLKDMTERKLSEELIRKAEKLSIVGQLSAGIAHEIRNPLTAIKGFVQLMRGHQSYNSTYLDIITEELIRIETIINELLTVSKPQLSTFVPARLEQILSEVIALVGAQALIGNIEITSRFDSELPLLSCDPNQIKQVYLNFFKNAMEAMPRGGTITLDAVGLESVPGCGVDRVKIRLTDQGHGIPKDQLDKLGEPFFTTKSSGTGLGLMVSFNIIHNHGGTIQIASEVGQGTVIDVTFPVLQGSQHTKRPLASY
ncbi:PAS domain S-box protein [Paenibacillus cremeus]|nr:PAS domain S-box protein [Paenibacillus cremeus]